MERAERDEGLHITAEEWEYARGCMLKVHRTNVNLHSLKVIGFSYVFALLTQILLIFWSSALCSMLYGVKASIFEHKE